MKILSPVPVASICTRSRLAEFLVTKFSLEQYHTCQWTLVCDAEVAEYVRRNFTNVTPYSLIEQEASHIRGEYEPFLKLVMHKMAVVRDVIAEHGACLFIDSDLIFLGALPLGQMVGNPIVVSEHYTGRPDVEARYGRFNVGMIYFESASCVHMWERVTRKRSNDHEGLEQKPLQLALEQSKVPYACFPKTCNVGWWRTYDHTFLGRISLSGGAPAIDGDPIVNFHFHLDPRIQRGEEREFARLVHALLSMSTDSRHQDLSRLIGKLFASEEVSHAST